MTFGYQSLCRSVIEEANWLTLEDDVRHMEDVEEGTLFDAVLCLGNSLSALPDFDGGLSKHRRAVSNFWALVRPGGLLVIDHRNYNCILETGIFPSSNIYYDVSYTRHPNPNSHFWATKFKEKLEMLAKIVTNILLLNRPPQGQFRTH